MAESGIYQHSPNISRLCCFLVKALLATQQWEKFIQKNLHCIENKTNEIIKKKKKKAIQVQWAAGDSSVTLPLYAAFSLFLLCCKSMARHASPRCAVPRGVALPSMRPREVPINMD